MRVYTIRDIMDALDLQEKFCVRKNIVVAAMRIRCANFAMHSTRRDKLLINSKVNYKESIVVAPCAFFPSFHTAKYQRLDV